MNNNIHPLRYHTDSINYKVSSLGWVRLMFLFTTNLNFFMVVLSLKGTLWVFKKNPSSDLGDTRFDSLSSRTLHTNPPF